MRHLFASIVSAGVLAASAFAGGVQSGPFLFIADSQNNRVRAVSLNTNVITTIAGNGIGLFGGDGGPAANANLKNPTGVAVFNNLLYIADNENNRIRMVNLITRTITTVAGTGAAGSGGDGGPATSAQLNGPYGVAVDVAGNLYIADTNNNRIREVSGGTITTVAGNGTVGSGGDLGPATSAQLYHPMGVAVDGSGNIYIADTDNQRVREVVSGSGLIITREGTGQVGYSCGNGLAASIGLHNPAGIAFDPFLPAILVADTGNQCVRAVQSGTNTVAVGNGIASYSGDGGLLTSPSVELNYPTGVATDSSANVYIADNVNDRVRVVNSTTGIITTLAGNGIAGFSGDGGLATSARLYNPTGIAFGIIVGP
jgi:sugar lactone lactonase YvrE